MARVVFFGTPDFSIPVLQALLAEHSVLAVVTQPDRVAGRGLKHIEPSPVKSLALAHNIEVLQPNRLRHDVETLKRLRQLQADVFVLAAYGQILPATVLEMAPHGCIGVHASLLPLLRGAAPIAAAILQGHEQTGITLMLTDTGMDSGPIIAQAALPIGPHDTTATLTERLARLGAELLIHRLPAWLAGEIIPQPQDDHLATMAPMISRTDAEIHWEKPALGIERAVRAFDPWPVAFTTIHGRVLRILSASALPDLTASDLPGTVLDLRPGIGVATGAGVLRLELVQLAGKRAMSAIDLARGLRGFIGTRLGVAPQ